MPYRVPKQRGQREIMLRLLIHRMLLMEYSTHQDRCSRYRQGGIDYVPLVNMSLELTFFEVSLCQEVEIIGDKFEETNETFEVTFTPHPTLNPEDVVLGWNNVTITILDNGDLECDNLTGPANGAVVLSDGTIVGSQANYSCSDGYVLEGNIQRIYQSDGLWTHSDPECRAVNCTALHAPTNGSVTGDGVSYQSEVSYSCDLGYILSGNTNRTCQADGVWTGTNPVCNIVNCTALDPPTNGIIDGDGVSYESEVSYDCDVGYILSDCSTRTCQANGAWTGTKPVCNSTTIPVLSLNEEDDADLNLAAILVPVCVAVLLTQAVLAFILLVVWRSHKKAGKLAPTYVVYDNTAVEQNAPMDGSAEDTINTSTTSSSFQMPLQGAAPRIHPAIPDESPPETEAEGRDFSETINGPDTENAPNEVIQSVL